MFRRFIAAAAAVLAFALAAPASAGESYTNASAGPTAWVGKFYLNNAGDFVWYPGGALAGLAPTAVAGQCSGSGIYVVRKAQGAAYMYAALMMIELKLRNSGTQGIAVYVYTDTTSVATACDGGTSSGNWTLSYIATI